jgi:LPS O-antigen subunit length determinant protein (WzzB/FepE family)
MTKKTIIALAVIALASTAWTSNALAAKPKHKAAAPAAPQAETVPGVNPMTNAPPAPAVEHPAAYQKMPGVNPM